MVMHNRFTHFDYVPGIFFFWLMTWSCCLLSEISDQAQDVNTQHRFNSGMLWFVYRYGIKLLNVVQTEKMW